MSQLVVVRHAKTEDRHPRGDHERQLTDRGVADAAELGAWLAAQGLVPDLILCSTAVRARQTTDGLAAGAGLEDVPVWPSRQVYDGGVDGVADEVSCLPDDASSVWLVGHNPVLPSLVLELADPDGSAPDLVDQVEQGFPTATAAVLEVATPWDAMVPGAARLVALHTARA